MVVIGWIIFVLGLLLAATVVFNFIRSPHWFIRGWDFPRVQLAVITTSLGGAYAISFSQWRWWEIAGLGFMGLAVAWHLTRVYPYTAIASRQVQRNQLPVGDHTLRLLISNVEMENRRFDRLLDVVAKTDPDMILVVETDHAWAEALRCLETQYPFVVRCPQDNHYGMVLLSRLRLIDPEVRFIVQKDIPSIHTDVELKNGFVFRFHGVHPRPPEAAKQHTTPRDAELVIVGREVQREGGSAIVAGDLNDVAWSHTTKLFLRLSRLLDPRRGRGLYNTFHAEHWWLRFPLDHIFHSDDWRLVELQLMESIGSDHFPVFIVLSREPGAEKEQEQEESRRDDIAEANEKVRMADGEEDLNGRHGAEQSEPPGGSS